MATYVVSATQTLSTSGAAKFLFTSSSTSALLVRRVVPFLLPRMQPGLLHESLNSFTATPSRKRAQLGMDPWRAVGLPASSMDLVNLGGEVASSQLRFDGDLDLQA